MDQVNKTSGNTENENLEKLRKVFPEFIKDGIIDFDALRAFFEKEGQLPPNQEKYGLSWAGKSNAFKLIKTPATGTLIPDEKESVDFDKTENLFIEGDNLEVLKLLQKHYREQIKMIYIDPPYNTGKDFIYKDNFTEDKSDYYERTGQNAGGIPMTTNRDSSGRYHSDWLTMMYPRLFLARNLLKEDGVIFISIDDNEVANLRMIMDEIFGEDNFIDVLKWKRKKQPSFLATHTAKMMEYILIYAKEEDALEKLSIDGTSDLTKKVINVSNRESKRDFAENVRIKMEGEGVISAGRYTIRSMDVEYLQDVNYANGRTLNKVEVISKFAVSQEKIDQFVYDDLLFITAQKGLRRDVSQEEIGQRKSITDLLLKDWGDNQESESELIDLFGNSDYFDYNKPVALIYNFIKACFTEDEIVLDFFAGSGTTAHATMKINADDGGNRKWVCVQLPELTADSSRAKKDGFDNIAQIARERIRRATKKITDEKNPKLDLGFKVYTLSSSNYREWNTVGGESDDTNLKEQMKLVLEKPLVDNFDEKSVVYEIFVKEGFDLNSEVKKENEVWIVSDCHSGLDPKSRKIIITFADKLSIGRINVFGLAEGDTFVCFDSALDDTTKVNILRRKFNVKVI